MRFKMYFKLEKEELPIQYRKSILSFIKLSLSEYNQEYYEKLYHERDNIIKPFTFSVFLKEAIFKEESILIKDKRFEMNIAIQNYEIAIILYNAFNNQRNKKFPIYNNSWTLKEISMVMERKIETEEITIKFMSPLVVRSREEQNDYYYSFEKEGFIKILKMNIQEQLKITELPSTIIDTFEIKPIKAKKAIIKFYEKKIETSIGIFEIKGDKELLQYLYQAGMGSKRSSGFGMFQIIG